MINLTLRTDQPTAELALYKDDQKLADLKWEAHRQLAETLHLKIKELLDGQDKQLRDIGGLVCYQGPGSFTGLRIGLSVANALAASLPAAIVATNGDDWIEVGLQALVAGEDQKVVVPDYGRLPHITEQKK